MGKNDTIPSNLSFCLNYTDGFDDHQKYIYHKYATLENICHNIGKKMNEHLLACCQNFPHKHNVRSTIMSNHEWRSNKIGFLGSVEKYCKFVERYRRDHLYDPYFNEQFFSQSVFAPVENNDDLFLIKGQPTFFLKVNVINKRLHMFSAKEIFFNFHLNTSQIENCCLL